MSTNDKPIYLEWTDEDEREFQRERQRIESERLFNFLADMSRIQARTLARTWTNLIQ